MKETQLSSDEQKAMIDGIVYRDGLLRAVNEAAVLLQNAEIDRFKNHLSHGMNLIAESAKLDCIYLWKNEFIDGKQYCFQIFEWSPQKTMFADGTPYSYDDVVPGWYEVLSEGKYINGIVSTMNQEVQDHLTPSGILSIFVVPIFIEEQFWGFVGYDDCHTERVFTQEEEVILHSSSMLIANSFIRNEMVVELRDSAIRLKETQENAMQKLEALVEERTRELAMQSTMLTTLFDSIPDLIFVKDLDLRFLHCNKALLEHYGVEKENLIGKNDVEGLGVSREKAEEFNEWDRIVIRSKKMTINEENTPRGDGTLIPVETIKAPLILDDEVVGVLGIARDISRVKKAEQKLAVKYAYANTLTDALAKVTKSPDISAGYLKAAADIIVKEGCIALDVTRVGVWSYPEDGEALRSISCYETLTGNFSVQNDIDLTNRKEYESLLQSERLITTNDINEFNNFESFGGYDPNIRAMLDAPVRVDGKLVGVVCVEQDRDHIYPDGRNWLPEEQNFASSLADLMALAISGYERRIAREAAETANKAKSAFLTTMSHEIRTPMNSILGVTDILMQKESLPPEVIEGLSRIYNSCDMLLGIINDLLDFSKIEAGKMDIQPEQYKVANMINDTVQLNMMRIFGKPIEFELQVDENTPAKLIGDELRIKQILSNLLSNAFKYTETGKVCLSVVSEAWPDGDGVTLVLIVKDTGIGMTKDELSNLFEEYMRFNNEVVDSIEGTGLGLAITHGLVEGMNGGISVESELGVGSAFTVRIPQKTVDNSILGGELAGNLEKFRLNYVSRVKRGHIIRDMMPYGSVLIADDMESNLYVAIGLLEPYGLKIEIAKSGQQALDLISSGKVYDVIFMDHMMPEMDGIEATKRIRELGYTNPIVALTANAVIGQASVFLHNGFDEFISKPIDMRQLNAVLNRLIRDKHLPEAAEVKRQEAEKPIAKSDVGLLSKKIPGLDIASGIEKHDGNVKAYLRVLHSYAVSVRMMLKEMESVTEDKLDDYKIKVHGIKGASDSIFANKVIKTASDLEKAASNNEFGFVKKHNKAFLENTHKLIDEIDELLSEIDPDDQKPEKERPDKELLEQLLEACNAYDMNSTEEIMDTIDKYQYSSDDGLANWLKENIALLNYTEIVGKLVDVLSK